MQIYKRFADEKQTHPPDFHEPGVGFWHFESGGESRIGMFIGTETGMWNRNRHVEPEPACPKRLAGC